MFSSQVATTGTSYKYTSGNRKMISEGGFVSVQEGMLAKNLSRSEEILALKTEG